MQNLDAKPKAAPPVTTTPTPAATTATFFVSSKNPFSSCPASAVEAVDAIPYAVYVEPGDESDTFVDDPCVVIHSTVDGSMTVGVSVESKVEAERYKIEQLNK